MDPAYVRDFILYSFTLYVKRVSYDSSRSFSRRRYVIQLAHLLYPFLLNPPQLHSLTSVLLTPEETRPRAEPTHNCIWLGWVLSKDVTYKPTYSSSLIGCFNLCEVR